MQQREYQGAVTRRRKKLEPDPAVNARIIDAGVDVVQEHGVAALNLTAVLTRTNLSTRAFYRHFESMDDLIRAVFVHLTRAETQRIRIRMAAAANPAEAVSCWIDARLDLAFDQPNTAGLRHLSREAESLMFASPDTVSASFEELIQPLIEHLEMGLKVSLFDDIDPAVEAESIHGVVWACVHRHWDAGSGSGADVRRRVKQFCLRGLGVPDDVIAHHT
ncbi:MAG: TetR/AcrR family transcriptional regulator [Mycobacterium sp.]